MCGQSLDSRESIFNLGKKKKIIEIFEQNTAIRLT